MEPLAWLEQRAPGFSDLPHGDREALFNFSLLWSLFESKALSNNASARNILSLTHEAAAQGRLNAAGFDGPLGYFRTRYSGPAGTTSQFAALHLRSNDNPTLVERVLSGANSDPADSVAALLIVVYRLRNNLFHGVKWQYNIRDQRTNFEHACQALMEAVDQLSRPVA